MSNQIFISYQKVGGDSFAFFLNQALISRGYTVFYDLDSLSPGKEFIKRTDVDEKYVLFWADFNDVFKEKIIDRLVLPSSHSITSLSHPMELLTTDLSEIYPIVIMVTDYSKYSVIPEAVNCINNTLIEYVKKGKLQDMYGCKIDNFKQVDQVRYIKTSIGKETDLFKDLDDEFLLDDGEICWGSKIDPDIDVLFANKDNIPLVLLREYG